MPTERCWKCHEVKQGVELCPSDDRLCPDCYKENERLLQRMHAPASDIATAMPARLATGDAAGYSDATSLANDSKKTKPKQTRSRKNKPDESAGQSVAQTISQPSALTTEIHEPSCSLDYLQATAADAADHNAELTALRQLVSNQESEIKQLHCRLDYVLSFLGITEMAAESINDSPLSTPQINQPIGTHGDVTDAPLITEVSDAHDQVSWSQVVSKRQKHSLRDTLQQSVVTAVYIDQSIKKSREASVVVTGLMPAANKSDTEIFAAMCASEFHFQPNITSVKRLGRQLEGKTQPLLVNLKKADQAKQLIGFAKQLRQSSDPAIRGKVFINPNLTRAEAAAAYQIRVQRRAAHQQRHARTNGADCSDDGNYHHNADRLQNPSSDARQLQLNPLANTFKPIPATTAAQAD